jgi:hypothetical protein
MGRLRDWFLMLAADAAQSAGEAGEADRLLASLLRLTPDHFLSPYGSFVEALRAPDVERYLGKLRRTYPPAKAVELLGPGLGRGAVESDERVPQAAHTAGEWPALPAAPALAAEEAFADLSGDEPGDAGTPAEPRNEKEVEGAAAAEFLNEPAELEIVETVEDDDQITVEEATPSLDEPGDAGAPAEPRNEEELEGDAAAELLDEPAELEIVEAVEEDDQIAVEESNSSLDVPDEDADAAAESEEGPGGKPAPPPSPPGGSRIARGLRWLFGRRPR